MHSSTVLVRRVESGVQHGVEAKGEDGSGSVNTDSSEGGGWEFEPGKGDAKEGPGLVRSRIRGACDEDLVSKPPDLRSLRREYGLK